MTALLTLPRPSYTQANKNKADINSGDSGYEASSKINDKIANLSSSIKK